MENEMLAKPNAVLNAIDPNKMRRISLKRAAVCFVFLVCAFNSVIADDDLQQAEHEVFERLYDVFEPVEDTGERPNYVTDPNTNDGQEVQSADETDCSVEVLLRCMRTMSLAKSSSATVCSGIRKAIRCLQRSSSLCLERQGLQDEKEEVSYLLDTMGQIFGALCATKGDDGKECAAKLAENGVYDMIEKCPIPDAFRSLAEEKSFDEVDDKLTCMLYIHTTDCLASYVGRTCGDEISNLVYDGILHEIAERCSGVFYDDYDEEQQGEMDIKQKRKRDDLYHTYLYQKK